MDSTIQLAFILNGVAGGGTSQHVWQQIEPLVNKRYPDAYTVAWTEYAGHAEKLAAAFVEQGYSRIVVIGGDGTINQAVNGIMSADKQLRGHTTLAVLPGGTGSDFARVLGLHGLPAKDAWLAIENGTSTPVDVGEIQYTLASDKSSQQQRYFINICSIGFSADVVRRVGLYPRLKRWCRSLAYWAQGVLTQLPYYRLHPTEIRWCPVTAEDSDDQVSEQSRLYLAAICNGQFFGGGMRVSTTASLVSESLQLVRIRNINMWRAITGILPGLRSGLVMEKVGADHVRCMDGTQFVVTASEKPVAVEVDGEYIGTTPLSVQVVPRALQLCMPHFE